MQVSKVTAKGQTTLPKDVRLALGLEAGDKVRYILEDGRVQILNTRHVCELVGMLFRSRHRTISREEMNEAIA